MPLTYKDSQVVFSGSKGATNSTTPVTVVSDPGTGTQPYIVDKEDFGILNEDTVNATIILTLTGGTSRVIERAVLATGDKWVNGNRIVVNPGETLTLQLASAITTNQLTYSVAYYQVIN